MNKQLFLKSNAQKYISFVDNEKKKKEAELLVENIQELVEIETQKLSELLNLLENNLHPKNLEVEFIMPTKEPISEPTKEPIHEPIHEPIQEPIKEPIQELIQEPIQESIQELIQEPIQESIQEPIIEPKNDIVKNTILDIMNEVINEEKNSAETILVSSNKIDEDVKIQKSENIKKKKNKNKKYI